MPADDRPNAGMMPMKIPTSPARRTVFGSCNTFLNPSATLPTDWIWAMLPPCSESTRTCEDSPSACIRPQAAEKRRRGQCSLPRQACYRSQPALQDIFVDTVGSAAHLYRRLLRHREAPQYGLDPEDKELFAHSPAARRRKSATQGKINAVCLRSAPMRSLPLQKQVKRLFKRRVITCRRALKSRYRTFSFSETLPLLARSSSDHP